jgi:hypothetical protein
VVRASSYVDGQEFAAGSPGGGAFAAPDEGVALRAAGQGDQYAFPCGPGLLDAVVGAVAQESFFGPVGRPQQGDLPQGGEVSGAAVVGQCRVDLLKWIDVAVYHAAAQCLG